MELQDFRPSRVEVLRKNGEIIEFSPFDLDKEVYVIEKFGSLSKFIEKLNSDKTTLLRIIYKFVDNEKLKNFFSAEDFDRDDIIKLNEAFTKTILNSMPAVNNSNYKDFLKIHNLTGDVKADYIKYYDKFARRYGYSLDDFFKLTRRQLVALMEGIQDGDHEDLEVKASLSGKKLKPRTKMLEVSDEQNKENEDQAMKALLDMKNKYKAKVKK